MSRVGGMDVLRYTAFSDQPSGGNPAGVVLDPRDVDEATMLDVAAEVGYSETAYLWALDRTGAYRIRYYSPAAEVPFCGHATIASAVALADAGRGGELLFDTESGEVAVTVVHDHDGRATATLTSVPPSVGPVRATVVREAAPAPVAGSSTTPPTGKGTLAWNTVGLSRHTTPQR